MTAEQLATKASKAQLLGTPGKDPVRSMKAALARELKKADASRIVAVGDDLWQVAESGADASAPAAPAKKKPKKKTAAKAEAGESKAAKSASAKKTAAKKTAAKKTAAKKAEVAESPGAEAAEAADQARAAAEAPAEPSRKRKSRRKKKAETVVEPAVSVPETPEAAAEAPVPEPVELPVAAEVEAEAVAEAPAEVEAAEIPIVTPDEAAGEAPGKKRRNRRSRRKRRGNREEAAETATALEVAAAEAAAAEIAAEPELEPISVDQLTDVLAPKEMPVRADVPVTPDEAEIQAIYGDELSGTEPGAAFAEYEDELTEDEDRPMSPEMVSTRQDRQKRERRRRRERPRGEVVAARPQQPHRERIERPTAAPVSPAPAPAPAPAAAEIATDIYWPGNRLAARATAVLHGAEQRTLRGKQLARLMTTRGLLAGSPDTTWPHLESALVHDEKSRVARGMRPRVTARGRGTFEAVAQVSDRELAASESALENAVAKALAATHRALSRRLSALDLAELERVAHVFLTTQGYDDIAWIKRSQRSSYAVAVAPGGVGELLVGVRAGSEPVDRGGVGELRVGVQAKKLSSGMLLAPSPLSEAARQELRRNGPSLSVLAGDGFVSALVRAGIGVTVAHIAVPLIDDAFLSALGESE